MKKNLNIIQIRGIKGLILAGMIVCCLAAGFIVFPGWICMSIWNLLVPTVIDLPSIGLIQGTLLWGIIISLYFIFRKEKVVVCLKTPDGLSEEELKKVFADVKKQAQVDPVMQAMLKAREAELKVQQQDEADTKVNSDSGKV